MHSEGTNTYLSPTNPAHHEDFASDPVGAGTGALELATGSAAGLSMGKPYIEPFLEAGYCVTNISFAQNATRFCHCYPPHWSCFSLPPAMPSHTKISVTEAHAVLGLEQGCTFEEARASYRKAALRTHPDKNPDNPQATAEFQRIGEAFHVLSKHLSDPTDSDYDFSDDEDGYFDEEDLMDMMDFFLFMFTREMGSRGGFSPYMRFHPGGKFSAFSSIRPEYHGEMQEPRETQRQYQDRMERNRREREEAAERREREARIRKERKAREREEEKQAAEKRQKQKQEEKKSKAEKERKKAEEASKQQFQKSQKLRSEVFKAARDGNIQKVKQGVWENSVDATGGEVRSGCEGFVKVAPKDPKETLLHIAAKRGDLDLIEWLGSHGADMEEKDSQGLTVLHTALKIGQVAISKYIFENYPPDDAEALYDPPKGSSLLALALQSKEPELAWLILDNKLASPVDIEKAWQQMTSSNAKSSSEAKFRESDKYSDILQLLKKYGNLTPPATPLNSSQSSNRFRSGASEDKNAQQQSTVSSDRDSESAASSVPPSSQANVNTNNQQGLPRGRGRGRVVVAVSVNAGTAASMPPDASVTLLM
ncbi:hypothetical protein NMY22_g8590 [Coprinellus aureogranulatus]|nr:hypothetical protein NMY22_g8590 [Coprinellus aureogranulatus]